ncbi:MAG: carbon storage regulator CsrA [Syntrophomonadaceae bacterium]|jgi:carbon storage regulator|nr:carbon storage regulator CsrA [Syntrophomonadaceae bacterium]MDH7497733.1 carbon storage regulator CsrA [Syntrophomonadaceae bacterium]
MLVLTRKTDEAILLGDDIRITIVEIQGDRVRIGIEAPRSLPVYREEVYRAVREENRRAVLGSKAVADLGSRLNEEGEPW